jgi:hypothetical protein
MRRKMRDDDARENKFYLAERDLVLARFFERLK